VLGPELKPEYSQKKKKKKKKSIKKKKKKKKNPEKQKQVTASFSTGLMNNRLSNKQKQPDL
jgi:hypothetical protein